MENRVETQLVHVWIRRCRWPPAVTFFSAVTSSVGVSTRPALPTATYHPLSFARVRLVRFLDLLSLSDTPDTASKLINALGTLLYGHFHFCANALSVFPIFFCNFKVFNKFWSSKILNCFKKLNLSFKSLVKFEK